jgi:ADP-heptose:LPS heptosyltransferase
LKEHSIRKDVKRVVSGALARLCRRRPVTPAQLLAARPRRILVVRQHNQMGDMVCATPALRALRETFPEAEIALVCAPVNRDVVLHNPHLDRVLVFDKRACTRPAALLRFVGELRAFRPDAAFVLNSVSYSVTSAALAAASGAPLLIGGDSLPFGFDISRHAYSLVMPSRPELDRHAVDHNLAPLEAIGIVASDRGTVVVPSADEAAAAQGIDDLVAGTGGLWILHPGAGKLQNQWPAERFADVAARAVRDGRRVLVLQGPADGPVMAAYSADVGRRLAPLGLAAPPINPPVTVGVCAALLSRAERFLCNDTGLMHVAGAVGTPTLALFGPTDPALWGPRAPEIHCLRGGQGRLEALDVDTVWDRWRGLPPRSGSTGG